LRRCPRRKPASALEYGWVILDDVFDQQDARFNVAQQPRQRGRGTGVVPWRRSK